MPPLDDQQRESQPLQKSLSAGTDTMSKRVWFDKVDVIEFPYQLGDNPSVKIGVPVTIGWESQTRKRYEIDYFEVYEKGERKDLSLSAKKRTDMLLSMGYTMKEIQTRTTECDKIKKERKESSKNVKWDRLNIAMNNAGKTLRKIIPGSAKDESIVAARSA